MLRAFKYRMYPNQEQKDIFSKYFGAVRFVYNWGLEQKIRTYKEKQINQLVVSILTKN